MRRRCRLVSAERVVPFRKRSWSVGMTSSLWRDARSFALSWRPRRSSIARRTGHRTSRFTSTPRSTFRRSPLHITPENPNALFPQVPQSRYRSLFRAEQASLPGSIRRVSPPPSRKSAESSFRGRPTRPRLLTRQPISSLDFDHSTALDLNLFNLSAINDLT